MRVTDVKQDIAAELRNAFDRIRDKYSPMYDDVFLLSAFVQGAHRVFLSKTEAKRSGRKGESAKKRR
jgi:hypothetical protein